MRNRCWIWLHFEGGTLGTTVAEAAVEGSQMEAAEWRKIQGLSFHQCRTFSQSVIQYLRPVHDCDENSFIYRSKNVSDVFVRMHCFVSELCGWIRLKIRIQILAQDDWFLVHRYLKGLLKIFFSV